MELQRGQRRLSSSVCGEGCKELLSCVSVSTNMSYPDGDIVRAATQSHRSTISGSYDWLRFGQGATDRQCLQRSPAAVVYRDWSLRIGRMRGRAMTNDWRRWMARSVDRNRATSGSDHRRS